MATHYRTQGFILSKNDLREADRIYSVFTKDFGRLEILGRAIRKIKSKLRSGAELFYLSEIEFIQGKNYKTLTDALIIEKFKNIRKNLKKLRTAYQIAETLDGLIKGTERDDEIYGLLNEVFDKLNKCLSFTMNYKLLYYYFFWNLVSILGYQIDLHNCAVCRKRLSSSALYFDPSSGIVCCSETKIGISCEVVKILRIILQKDWGVISRLKNAEGYIKGLKVVTDNYFDYVKNQ